MGHRRLTQHEYDACSYMARSRVDSGEHEDDTEAHLIRYLVARGWSSKTAQRAATDVIREALAMRDGAAGAVE